MKLLACTLFIENSWENSLKAIGRFNLFNNEWIPEGHK
jgi:hypothetical protein